MKKGETIKLLKKKDFKEVGSEKMSGIVEVGRWIIVQIDE